MKQFAFFLFTISICLGACKSKPEQQSSNINKDGWISMFDGKTSAGWRAYNKDVFPEKGWKIENGELICLAKGKGGDIIFDERFQDFELSLEWNISKGGNSGIFYHAVEIKGKHIYFSAPEMQILDNENHSNGKVKRQQAGSLFDILPAEPQNAKPFGKWNKASILVKDNHVTHFQNDQKVVEYSIAPDDWKKLIKGSKFETWEPYVNKAPEGYIGLQYHGDEVRFRNIRIRRL